MHERSNLLAVHYLFQISHYVHIKHVDRQVVVLTHADGSQCQDNNLPIYVFNMDVVGILKKVMDGEQIGTLVHN